MIHDNLGIPFLERGQWLTPHNVWKYISYNSVISVLALKLLVWTIQGFAIILDVLGVQSWFLVALGFNHYMVTMSNVEIKDS